MSRSRFLRAAAAAALAAVFALSTGVAPAYAGGHGHGGGGGGPSATSPGYDISYPQCNGKFPTGAAFGIVGVNGGRVYLPNPCLGTQDGPSELAWAGATGNAQFYANTGNPGPNHSSYWDIAGWNNYPQTCTADDPNSTGCSYDYGWYAAQDSFSNAVSAEFQVHPGADAVTAAAGAPWWLDVETGNSWQVQYTEYPLPAAYANDTAALAGAVSYLRARGVAKVGFYSTRYQWGQITGGASFPDSPNWLAGFSDASSAVAGCTIVNSFTGGPVALTQYHAKGYDADHAC